MLRFTTAGESHGVAIVAVLEGMVAGLPLLASDIDSELARRQQGYGRGRRMQIESDHAQILSGVRAGETIGSPIAMIIQNRDWKNWQDIMDTAPREGDPERKRTVTRPRPGHADLSGMLKYDRSDARDILERASARETTARVAAGAICKRFLREFDITIGSHVVHLGGVDAKRPENLPVDLNAAADQSQVRTLDAAAEAEMIARIDAAKKDGNTLGGIAEVICDGVPVGLGSHVSWDRKLDGRIAAAIMSIPAVKAVEIGLGVECARRMGSDVHDEIYPDNKNLKSGRVRRKTNRAGGMEGGITTGEQLVLRASMKPISTLMRPLNTVDMKTREPAQAVAERSDVTAVPAMGVIAEGMTAFIVAQAFLEKFGGDSLSETRRNYENYITSLSDRQGR
ncbi:MAG TPA: chorismate synthase [Gemmatimonadaceae bacterium]|nr:chorismate synthase [Gemmatimonadaceae bacterium]